MTVSGDVRARDKRRHTFGKWVGVIARLLTAMLLLGFSISGFSPSAQAQDPTWNAGTADWFTGPWIGGVPNGGSLNTSITNGGTAQITSGTADAGSGTPGATLTIGGGSTLDLQSGGGLNFKTMIIESTGTFQAANDNWGGGCNAPCITMAGGRFLSTSGDRVYDNGFTFQANTTSTIKSTGTSLTLNPNPSFNPSLNAPYIFQNGAVVQFGGTINYSGGATVTAGADTGIVVLSGATLKSLGLTDAGASSTGLNELTSKVSTTTIEAGGTLDFNSIPATINNLQGDGTLKTGASGTVISLGQGDFGGTITGSGGITQLGGGVTTLSGANDYTGPTIINANGTLIVNGSIASNVTVDGMLRGGTLAMPGSVGGVIVNNTISPGTTAGVLGQLNVNGTAQFGPSATYAADVDVAAGKADRISVTGTATVDGTVNVNVLNPIGPSHDFILLSSAGLTDNGVTLSGVSSGLIVAYSLSTTATDLILGVTVDFSPAAAGLNANQTALGDYLNDAVTAGSGNLGPVLSALIGLPTADNYRNALDQLSPEIYNYDLIETLYASQQFSNDLMSCRVAGNDGAAFIREGQCIWVRARARFLELDHTNNNIGADDTTGSFSAGAQVAFAPDWRLGFAAGYDRIELDTSTGATSDGDRANVGGVLKYNPGPLLLAAGVTAGWGLYDTTRTLSFGGFNAEATSNNDINYVSGQVHAAYLFSQGNWYLKPLVDAGVTELDLNGFTEHGGGGAALIVPGRSDTVFNVSPALEIGTEMRFDNVSVWRPFVRAGATWQDTGSFVLNAGFFDAPQGVSPFTIRTKLDQVLADVGAGVDIINTAGAVLRVQYDGKFAQVTQQNSVSLKGSAPF